MTRFNGICGSKGYSSGYAVVKNSLELKLEKTKISDVQAEFDRFRNAQNVCDARLMEIIETAEREEWIEAAEIFRAYRSIVRDEIFYKTVFNRVETELINIEYALHRECKKAVATFEQIESDYLRERASDIENACNELIRIMLGVNDDFQHKMEGYTDVVLVATEITPAELVKIDKNILRGIVTERGGITSHTVILTKVLGIPAIVGAVGATKVTRDGDLVLLDAFLGEGFVNPDEATARAFAAAKRKYDGSRKLYKKSERLPAVTKDGFAVNVSINSGDPDSTRAIDYDSCDGVGLMRTEFIYLNSTSYPDEHTQFEIYKDVVTRANGKAVVFRTLDVGGDKQARYMKLPKEHNPALGFRGIRPCLEHKDIFAVQLRAILRVSAFGNIKIMFPMIVSTEELIGAKKCLEDAKQMLRDENIAFREDIPVGVMVETPAAVLLSDKLALYADFFSVGTNDLIQYTTAADRENERVASLYDCCNISVLRAVKIIAESAERAGIPWGICGEAASEERLVPLWVAMGVKTLSVAPSTVGSVKHLIGRIDRADMIKQLETVLNFDLIEDVKSHMDALLQN